MALQHFFQALDFLAGRAQRGALGQLDVQQQLQARRGREELLRHQAEQQQRADEGGEGQDDHRLAVAHAPLHQTPEALVEGRCIGIVAVGAAAVLLRVQPGQVRQQLGPQVGNEDHRGEPGDHQGDGHHLEQRAGVFAAQTRHHAHAS